MKLESVSVELIMKQRKYLFLLGMLGLLFLTGLKAKDDAPEFSGINQDGKAIHLSDFNGKFVLIFFYPKDDTPGCTKEACSFRDEYAKIKALNSVVLGVSRQDQRSHLEFKNKHKLPFDLLVDKDGTIAQAFGVGQMPVIGLTKRQSVLIGPDRKIIQFYSDVNPENHTREVLADIQKASQTH